MQSQTAQSYFDDPLFETAVTQSAIASPAAWMPAEKASDIINLNYAERVIFTDDERLNSILASLNDVVWSIETNNFSTTYMSPAAQRFYGWPADKFYESPSLWLDMVLEEDREHYLGELFNIFEKGLLHFQYRIRCADGSIKWVSDHITVCYDEQQQPLRIDGISHDITQQIEAEASLKQRNDELNAAYSQLQTLQNQLLQSEKMASIGQLAAGVAHEINNPIGYVYSNLGTLQRYLQDIFLALQGFESVALEASAHAQKQEKIAALKQQLDIAFIEQDIHDLMHESREGITRVKKIVQDLKDFSHADTTEYWEIADLHAGIDSTLNIVNNEIKYKVEVIKHYTEIPAVECLPAQLNQVFMNMLVNASHAIEEKGQIIIQTALAGDQVVISFIDNGKGIPEDIIHRIYDPFFTTKPVGSGTGLGLSLSYNIVQKHGGRIQVQSTLGQGTRFDIYLPILHDAAGVN